MLLVAILLTAASMQAAPGDLDLKFNPDFGPVPRVGVLGRDAAGGILVAFYAADSFVGRLLPDGKWDASYVFSWAPPPAVLAVTGTPEGGILVLGSANGTANWMSGLSPRRPAGNRTPFPALRAPARRPMEKS